MATADAIRQRVRDTVYSAMPPERSWIDISTGALVDANDVDFTVTDGTNYEAGDILEFYDHGEQVLVVSIAGNTLTVKRGWAGTTAAAQGASSVIAKNPRFTRKQMDDVVAEVLASLEGFGIHAFGQGSVTLVAGQYSYDVTETDMQDPYGIIAVYYEETVDPLDLHPLPFKTSGGTHTSIVASGRKLRLLDWGDRNIGDSVFYTYAKKIDSVTDLLVRQEELVRMGAAARLLGVTIAPRTQDPGRYTDRTVQPGQGSRDKRDFLGEFLLAAAREAAQLATERDQLIANMQTRTANRWVS